MLAALQVQRTYDLCSSIHKYLQLCEPLTNSVGGKSEANFYSCFSIIAMKTKFEHLFPNLFEHIFIVDLQDYMRSKFKIFKLLVYEIFKIRLARFSSILETSKVQIHPEIV